MYYIIIISLTYSYRNQYNHNHGKQRNQDNLPDAFHKVLIGQTYAEKQING
mgnify:CR=1 FL=1